MRFKNQTKKKAYATYGLENPKTILKRQKQNVCSEITTKAKRNGTSFTSTLPRRDFFVVVFGFFSPMSCDIPIFFLIGSL